MALVAGIDSSTQSCKVVVRDADTGALVRTGRASHPDGTEVAPSALVGRPAVRDRQRGGSRRRRGGLGRRPAARHGRARRPRRGGPRRAAVERHPLGTGRRWTSSTSCGGPQAWADAVGSVPVASLTVTKLRWLRGRRAGERRARRRRRPPPRLAHLAPRRGSRASTRSSPTARTPPAPATGRPPPRTTGTTCSSWPWGTTRCVPRVLGPSDGGPPDRPAAPSSGPAPATTPPRPSRSACSPATSPSPSAPPASSRRSRRRRRPTARAWSPGSPTPPAAFLPLACTLNASRVLDAAARMLGVDHAGLSALALSAPAGADGLVLVPYLEGERTPNKPDATGALHGMRLANTTPGAPRARRGRGHAVRARRRDRRAARAGRRGRAAVPHRRRRAVRGRAGDRAVGARARRPRPDARRVRGRRRRPPGRLGALRVRDAAVVELGLRGDGVHRRPGRRRSASSTPRCAS